MIFSNQSDSKLAIDQKNLRNVFRHFVIGFKSMGSTLEKMSNFDGKAADEKLHGA